MNPSVNDFYVQSLLLSEIVRRILDIKENIQKVKISQIEKKPVIEFMKRMRVTSLEKFDETTYISTINFYKSPEDLKKHITLGVVVVYIPEEYIDVLLRNLDYPVEDDADEDYLASACGTVCNLIAGNFKSGLRQLGYKELEMSHFSNYQNVILDGVEYCIEHPEKYEITFEIRNEKCLVVDYNMGKIPKLER